MINKAEQMGKPEWWAGYFVSICDSWVIINELEDLKYRLKGWWFSRMVFKSKVMFQGYIAFGWSHQYTNLALKNGCKLTRDHSIEEYFQWAVSLVIKT